MLLTILVSFFILVEIIQDINSHFYQSLWDIFKPIGFVFLCEICKLRSVPIFLFICYLILGGLCSLILLKKVSTA
jgi:hypothetical protein